MGKDVMTQREAWATVDVFFANPSVALLDEPADLTAQFRAMTSREESSPKQWADGYLMAFARIANLHLVTFDRALAKAAKRSILLS